MEINRFVVECSRIFILIFDEVMTEIEDEVVRVGNVAFSLIIQNEYVNPTIVYPSHDVWFEGDKSLEWVMNILGTVIFDVDSKFASR